MIIEFVFFRPIGVSEKFPPKPLPKIPNTERPLPISGAFPFPRQVREQLINGRVGAVEPLKSLRFGQITRKGDFVLSVGYRRPG